MRRWLRGLLLALVMGLAVPTGAQTMGDDAMLSARDPERIASALRQLGYRATVTKQRDGDPMIETAMAGYNAKMLFMTCRADSGCEDVQLFVGVLTDRKLSLEQVNAFNTRQRFTRLYLDEERDPMLELDLSMLHPGISFAAFRDTVAVFEAHLGRLGGLIDAAR